MHSKDTCGLAPLLPYSLHSIFCIRLRNCFPLLWSVCTWRENNQCIVWRVKRKRHLFVHELLRQRPEKLCMYSIIIDCKTVCIFAYSSTRKQSSNRSEQFHCEEKILMLSSSDVCLSFTVLINYSSVIDINQIWMWSFSQNYNNL